MTLDEALTKLRAAKPLLDRYGVARIGLFGSTVRGEAGPDSDLDCWSSLRRRYCRALASSGSTRLG